MKKLIFIISVVSINNTCSIMKNNLINNVYLELDDVNDILIHISPDETQALKAETQALKAKTQALKAETQALKAENKRLQICWIL